MAEPNDGDWKLSGQLGFSGRPSSMAAGMIAVYRVKLQAEARREGAREALHMGEPWPIPDILNRLAGAAEHLLSVHSCDAHGYEGVDAAIKAARALSDEPPKEGESR